MAEGNFVLTLSCADRPGIVAAVTAELFSLGGNIAESNQFWDRQTGRFFMRIAFTSPEGANASMLREGLEPVVSRFGMTLSISDRSVRPRIVILVSRQDHALLHLLYQIRVGWLNAEVAAIVSNHETSRRTAEHEGVPFHHWPMTPATRADQEARIVALFEESAAELVVLARYMQVLSDGLTSRFEGRIINIHHSFLPSFKGAKPYHQAHERGVKLIGATAHYVTADLDEGPIIEQETARVSHAHTPEDLIAAGRDIESRVLARAVKYHLEERVMLNGNKTVVFA